MADLANKAPDLRESARLIILNKKILVEIFEHFQSESLSTSVPDPESLSKRQKDLFPSSEFSSSDILASSDRSLFSPVSTKVSVSDKSSSIIVSFWEAKISSGIFLSWESSL